MELLQLKYFCDAAETQNFSKTAKKFGVPPSDISRTVSRLEKELGANLFSRGANSLKLNRNGKLFYEKVKNAILEIEDAKIQLSGENEDSGEIKICVCTNRRIITQVIENFKKDYPMVSFVIKHYMESSDYDYSFLVTDEFVSSGKRALVIKEEILLAARKDFPEIDKINAVSDLKNVKFVTMQEKSSNYRIIQHLCHENGIEPQIAIQTDDPFYVRKYIELGMGVSFIPAFSWSGLFSEDVILKKITDYERNTFVYTNNQKHLSACEKKFLDVLLKYCKDKILQIKRDCKQFD